MKPGKLSSLRPPPAFWLILFISLLLRVIWLGYARPVPVYDFHDYQKLAERLIDEHGYLNPGHEVTAFRLPGYPWFLAFLMLFSRDTYWLSLGATLLSTSICLVLYLFTKIISGGRNGVALAAAAVGAFYPPFIFYSPVLASEPLEAVLDLWAFVLLLMKPSLTTPRALFAGIIMAAACLTRGSSLLFIPVACLAVLLTPAVGRKKRLSRLVVFLAATAIPLGAWWMRNRILIGPGLGLSTQGGINFYYAHNPHNYGWRACLKNTSPLWKIKNEVEMSREGYRRGWNYIKTNPGHIWKNIKISSQVLYSVPVYSWAFSTKSSQKSPRGRPLNRPLSFLPWAVNLTIGAHAFFFSLVVLSIFRWPAFPRKGLLLILLLLAAHWIFYTLIFHGAPRYGYLSNVLFCPLTGLTLAALTGRDRSGKSSELPGKVR